MWPSNSRDLGYDLAAALALAAVAIPEQLATARLAGVPPATGLIVFVAGALGFFLLGANRFLSAGADSTIAPIFAGSLALLAASGAPHYLALCAGLALLVGAIVGAAGLLRLGWISRLLSQPVITGFLAGIAIHIALSQLPALLGIAGGHGGAGAEMAAITRGIGEANIYAVAIGVSVFAAALACEKTDIRIPGALIAAVLAGMAVWLFGLDGKGVAVLGQVDLIKPAIPDLSLADITHLIPVAVIVSLVVMIQTAATSQSFAGEGMRANVNHDFVGVGLGSLFSGLAGGFPVNASPPRTAIVSGSGGHSRLAGLFAALVVLLFLALGLKLLRFLPQAALAGLLLFVAVRIFRFGAMRKVALESPAEFGLLAATAIAIVGLPIATGVGIGIALSLLHGVWTIAQTRVLPFQKVPGTTVWWPASPAFGGEALPGIVVLGFQAPLFFLNAQAFRDSLDRAVGQAPGPVRAIILEASAIAELDFTGAEMLADAIKDWKEKGVDFYIARLESLRAQQALERFGVLQLLGAQCIFHSVDDAVRHIAR